MRLAIRQSSRRFVMIDVDDIYYVESDGHDTLIRLARRSKLKSVRSLADIERLLVPRGFARIHRSYLVAREGSLAWARVARHANFEAQLRFPAKAPADADDGN